ERQREGEDAALALAGRLRPDAAAVRGDDALAEVQAEAFADDAARRVGAVSAAEELREISLVDAHALVAHLYRRVARVRRYGHCDGRAFGRVLERIRKKIHEHLPDSSAVPAA